MQPSFPSSAESPLSDPQALFRLIDRHGRGFFSLEELQLALAAEGILPDDQRIGRLMQESGETRIDAAQWEELLQRHHIVQRALLKELVIPEFAAFRQSLDEIFEETKKNEKGKVADYIPQLARVDPDQFAVSVCTIDGQRFSLGDASTNFCLQSTCKPVNYCLAMDELGEEKVHSHVGREPSGRTFNELSLNNDGLPHNPLINAGAIMCLSLLKRELSPADRFDYVFDTWRRLCAGHAPAFNNAVYLSERQTADRNFALAYFMREKKAFPPDTDLIEALEFYFQCCSIESCTHHLALAAATLANAGINPLTDEEIFDDETVQHCMSLMLTCGMYDFSGEFAFRIGLPAKSGVSGALFLVVPNVMGISIWSPRLDKIGNSVRGVEFCERLIERYNFHLFDSLTRETAKINPRRRKYEGEFHRHIHLLYAASCGDLDEIKRLEAAGADLNLSDYDGRTALHLAVAENRPEVVAYLLSRQVDRTKQDRWGNTPLEEARRLEFAALVGLLARG